MKQKKSNGQVENNFLLIHWRHLLLCLLLDFSLQDLILAFLTLKR